jgi:signal transduction histidine kinase
LTSLPATRLYWRMALYIGAALAAFVLLSVASLALVATQELEGYVAARHGTLGREAAAVLTRGGRPALQRWLRLEARVPPDVTIYVLDEQARDILDRQLPEYYESFIRRSVVGRPEPRGSNYQPVHLAPQLIGPGGEVYAFLVLPNRIGLLGNRATTLGLLAIAILVIGSIAWLIARTFARPIGELQRVVREIASGQLEARVPATITGRPDEIGALAADFNSMADQITQLLSSRQQLMGELSHALRSPLARLQAALALPNHRERAEHEIARLDRVIGALLRLSRLEAAPDMARRIVRIDDLLAALVRDEELEARGRQVRLELHAEADLAVVGDPELLHSACENLLRNAIRYTQAGTSVEIHAKHDGAQVRIFIEDRGPGVPRDYLARIFDRWVRVPDVPGDPGGTGLGLAIARRVFELHDGSLEAALREGGGLSMRARLPRAQLQG